MFTRNALLDTSFLSRIIDGTFNIQEFLPVTHYKLWLHDTCLKEAFLSEAGQQANLLENLYLIKKLETNIFYFSYLILEEFIDRNPNIKLKPYIKD